jgi:hypothetical protein
MKITRYKYTIVALLLLIATACQDFGDMNVDPNRPTEVPASKLLTQGLFALTDLYWSREANFEYGMLLAQHLAQAEYTEEQRYSYNTSDFNFEWTSIYSGGLADLHEAKRLVEADETLPPDQKANQLAVLDIYISFAFQMATDIWGDIPYSQAFQPDEFVQPAYDSQSEIYNGLISTVTEAVNAITPSAEGFGGADILLDGNMDAWQKFGNGLLLRMGMRIADANPSLAATTVANALSGNMITATSDEIKLIFSSDQRLANPFYVDAVPDNRDDFRITEELLGTLQDLNDPREIAYADSTATGAYIGMPYGLEDGDAFDLKSSTSRFAASIRQATAPAFIIRLSEMKFYEAEAIERGFVDGDAEAAFNEAITASMNEWGITDADAIADYLDANPYDAANWKESIGLQLWIALYTNGLEAWANVRRLDEPELAVPEAAFTDYIPVRGLYPTDEQTTNSANLGAVSYENSMDVNLWWDVN